MPAGRWTKLPAGSDLVARSTFSPDEIAKRPEITVTNSSLEWRCGGTMKPAGNLRRSTNGPSLAGLPNRTAACAPGGREGGAGPQVTASADTTVWWCCSAACGWVSATNSAATPNDSARMRRIKRECLGDIIAPVLLLQWQEHAPQRRLALTAGLATACGDQRGNGRGNAHGNA